VTRVSICGSNIANASDVEFNGVTTSFYLSSPSGTTPECLAATVPAAAPTGPITVRTPQGSFTTAQLFNVLPIAAPLITNVSPTSARSGQTVVIEGENFIDITKLLFNGTPAQFESAGIFPGVEMLVAFVPTNATTGPITLTSEYGSFTTADPFTVETPGSPVVDSFSPTSGTTDTIVEIHGSNLYNPISVAFGGVEQLGGAIMVDILVVRVGPNAKTGPITVTTASGTYTTRDIFTVLPPPPPSIRNFAPQTGPPGAKVFIYDAAQSSLKSVTDVQFNGVNASFEYVGIAFCLIATVPTNATTGPITVISPRVHHDHSTLRRVPRYDSNWSGTRPRAHRHDC
jgi:hypothetical protein